MVSSICVEHVNHGQLHTLSSMSANKRAMVDVRVRDQMTGQVDEGRGRRVEEGGTRSMVVADSDAERQQGRGECAHRRVLALGSVVAAAAAMLAVVAMGSRGAARVVLAAGGGSMGVHKTHVAHAVALTRVHKKAHGNKYERELASLAREAGPSRRSALAKIASLRKRSEHQEVSSSKHTRKIPQALRAMERLANKRADFSHHVGSGADMLSSLERAHGIRSSKDELAEIMSLRHYKKADKQISEMQHGFEAHSSMSHRVIQSVGASKEARAQERHDAANKRQEASALRLEAGRYSRDQMLGRAAKSIESKIGQSLVQTFKPIKGILHKDETVLDAMLSPSKQKEAHDKVVDAAADAVRRQLRVTLRREADRVIKQKKISMFHKSKKYLLQVQPCPCVQ